MEIRLEGILNTHIIILWHTLQVYDQQEALKLLKAYLDEAQKWAKRSLPNTRPGRQRRHPRTGLGFILRYVWVNEHSEERGFHTHIVCRLPKQLKPAFAEWSLDRLAAKAKHKGDQTTLWVEVREGSVPWAINHGWFLFRYITKQLDPESRLVKANHPDEPPRPMRAV